MVVLALVTAGLVHQVLQKLAAIQLVSRVRREAVSCLGRGDLPRDQPLALPEDVVGEWIHKSFLISQSISETKVM